MLFSIFQNEKHPSRGALLLWVCSLFLGIILFYGNVFYGDLVEKGEECNQDTPAYHEESFRIKKINSETVKDKYGADRQRNNDPAY